jgi:hypothetical protein
MSNDEAWATLARTSRAAMAHFGKETPPCLPDEAEACGATFAQHAAAHLAVLKAVADHHLEHLGPEFVACIYPDVYQATQAELAELCPHEPPHLTEAEAEAERRLGPGEE